MALVGLQGEKQLLKLEYQALMGGKEHGSSMTS